MFLYLLVDGWTMKKVWDFEKCGDCLQRFECYTEDCITVRPDKVDMADYDNRWWSYQFKAEFHLPKCIRIGLFKQIADTGYWSHRYPTEFGDGFKLGGVFEDEGEHISIERSWIKLPNILYVTGAMK